MVSGGSNGSDWGIVATLVGCLIVAAVGLWDSQRSLNYPKEQRYQSYRYAADKPLEVDPAAPVVPPQTFEYRKPCEGPKGKDESDLCAQWRAAKAAENSAFWAKWSFWVGIGGMIGLFWTLYYTREAVKDTGDATKAMLRQNELTERAQRPWIVLDCTVTKLRKRRNRMEIAATVSCQNIGKMVALSFCYEAFCKLVAGNGPKEAMALFRHFKSSRRTDSLVLIPGETASQFIDVSLQTDIFHFDDTRIQPDYTILVAGAAHYKIDPAGPWHSTEVSFRIGLKADDPYDETYIPQSLADGDYTDSGVARRYVTGVTT
jgi:hypothetical protein